MADIETGDGGTGDTNGTIFRLGNTANPSNAVTVTINGLTIDGNNAALPIASGRLLNGVYVDTVQASTIASAPTTRTPAARTR